MKRSIILILLAIIPSAVCMAQLEIKEDCSSCIAEHAGISTSYVGDGMNIGLTVSLFHAEYHFNMNPWTPDGKPGNLTSFQAGDAATTIEHSYYIGSLGLSYRISNRISIQIGADLIRTKQFQTWTEESTGQNYWKHGKSDSYEDEIESQLDVSAYLGVQLRVTDKIWLGTGYGLERGPYYSFEFAW